MESVLLFHHRLTQFLKIESQPDPDAARAQGVRRDEERVQEGSALFGARRRTQRGEIDELRAEGEDGFVERVVNLDGRAQGEAFAEAKFARDVEIEGEEGGAAPGVAREISNPPDDGQRERLREFGAERFAGTARAYEPEVAVEVGTVVADVVEVAIRAAEREVELYVSFSFVCKRLIFL